MEHIINKSYSAIVQIALHLVLVNTKIYVIANDKIKLLSWERVFFPRLSFPDLEVNTFCSSISTKFANISVLRQTWNFQLIPQTNSSQVYKLKMEVVLITQPATMILWPTEQTWSLQNTTNSIQVKQLKISHLLSILSKRREKTS